MYESILTETDAGVGIITLNRPERHNAFDETMLAEMTDTLRRMANDEAVRLIVVSSTGQSFCAHGEGHGIDGMLAEVSACPKPVIARVQGHARGVGVALVAACDMAVASFETRFALTDELPAGVAPYIVAAMGERHARRYLLTAETFSAAEAYRIGLIHEMVADAQALDLAIGEWVDALLASSPSTQAKRKAEIRVAASAAHRCFV